MISARWKLLSWTVFPKCATRYVLLLSLILGPGIDCLLSALDLKKVSLGAAIYPTLALFNHGCDPSFMRCNNGNSVICVASKAISAGDEIFENYGLMFTVKTLGERQKILQNHYGFKCECVACVENWPDTISMLARRQANINNPLSR